LVNSTQNKSPTLQILKGGLLFAAVAAFKGARWLPAMQERFIASSEAAPIVLNRIRRNRRVAEAWMALNVWRDSLIDIPPGRGESIMKTLSGDLRKFRRRRWLVVYRTRMRTSGNGERQRKGCKG
jgi:hypothetical protein